MNDTKQQNNTVNWSNDVHRLFQQHKIKMVSFVPDGGLKKLIQLCERDSDMHAVTLTTEEEGVAGRSQNLGGV